ncbi:MAG: hypothetical protein WCB02_05710, partial [Bradyrhizobium sp.]
PLVLYLAPTLFGVFAEPVSRLDFVRHVGTVWLAIGICGGLVRLVQLFVIRDPGTGLIWVFKVLTDPLHNIALYYKSPLALLRGELIDSTIGGADWTDEDAKQAAHPL